VFDTERVYSWLVTIVDTMGASGDLL